MIFTPDTFASISRRKKLAGWLLTLRGPDKPWWRMREAATIGSPSGFTFTQLQEMIESIPTGGDVVGIGPKIKLW